MITNTILLPTWILMINNFNSDLTWSQKKPIFLVGQFIFLFIFFYNFTGFQKKKAIEFSWRTNIFGWQNLTFFQKCALRKKNSQRGPTWPTKGFPQPLGIGFFFIRLRLFFYSVGNLILRKCSVGCYSVFSKLKKCSVVECSVSSFSKKIFGWE